ncbi:hypothetical protein ACD591_11740 [Rufibacter glacialis]|uniref:STAS/SEC14 domain-containing protein n=1 Tax=Rufibacter glacialis TaxID=1259555 RepID=A0A5M8QQ01_9BACT|nr:hypothetical protein [Rufibacter glacialis]KAA6437358.1 hypothetical protein FOE74_02335 [Rufibacter glacialis]GGK59968.1 hypothetical protein GCM10011405_05110 [Rufibacter glacialis]
MKIGFSKHIKISYRADMQTVIIRWQQPVTFTEFKMNCLAILSLAREHTASSWLLDCRSKGEITQQESDWLSNEFYPKSLQQVSSWVLVAWLLTPRQMQRLQEGALSAVSSDCPDVCRKAFLTEHEAVKWLEDSVAQIEHRKADQ